MRAAVYHGPGDIRVEDVPDAAVSAPTDAVVRVLRACICGSDLWSYRGHYELPVGRRTGHEFMGIVEDVGAAVTSLRRGQLVLAPFYFCDGTCEFCLVGLSSACRQIGGWGGVTDGGQGEAVRVPFADTTLVPVPGEDHDDELLLRLLPLTDVLSTGHHACVSAGVGPASTVAVVGDGAVGLCAVLAAVRLGAQQVIAVGHHASRLDLAKRFGATDVVRASGDEAVAAVQELTSGGATAVCECVGNQAAVDAALAMTRAGGRIGWVGVPAAVTGFDMMKAFGRNIALAGGVAPARDYIPQLLPDVLAGHLDASAVLDLPLPLEQAPEGYRRMDDRSALKVVLTP